MHGHHYRRSAKNVHAMCVVDLLRNLDDQNINEVDCCLAKVMMGIDGCFILMFPLLCLQQPVVLPSVGTPQQQPVSCHLSTGPDTATTVVSSHQ